MRGNDRSSTWTIEGSEGNYSGRSVSEQGTRDFESVSLSGNALTVVLPGRMGTMEITVVITGDEFEGSATIDARGRSMTINLTGERTSSPEGGAR